MSKSTPKRPSAGRVHTRTSTKKAKDALEVGIRVERDGKVYQLRLGDVDAASARRLRSTTGYGPMALMQAFMAEPDVDLLASFIWLCDIVAGRDTELDDVEVSYDDIFADDFTFNALDSTTGPEAESGKGGVTLDPEA